MPIEAFDHVNIRTSNLEEMVAFYGDVLDLHAGWRPPFSNDGAWMYLGDQPIVHLVGVATAPQGGDVKLEHFALRATGLAEFLDRLRARDILFSVDPIPGNDRVQVNFHDPDGTHIHVDFPATEHRAAG